MAVPLRKKDRYVGLLLMWIWHNTSFIFNANPIKHPWTLKMKHCNLGSTFHPPTVYSTHHHTETRIYHSSSIWRKNHPLIYQTSARTSTAHTTKTVGVIQ